MSCEETIRSIERVKRWAAGLNWSVTVIRIAATGSIYIRFNHNKTHAWLWVRFSDHPGNPKYRLSVHPGGTPLNTVLRNLVKLSGGRFREYDYATRNHARKSTNRLFDYTEAEAEDAPESGIYDSSLSTGLDEL